MSGDRVGRLIFLVTITVWAAGCGTTTSPSAPSASQSGPPGSAVASTLNASSTPGSAAPSPSGSASGTPGPETGACLPPLAAGSGSKAPLQVIHTVAVPVDGTTLAAGFGTVWASSTHGLIDLSVPAAAPTVVLTEPVDDLALSAHAVFVVSRTTRELIEVDGSTRRDLKHWALDSTPTSLSVSGGSVYVDLGGPPHAIERVDIATGTMTSAPIPSLTGAANGQGVAVGGGSVWVTDGQTLDRLDPSTLAQLGTTRLPRTIDNLWFGDGALWASTENPGGGVFRLDPTTGCATIRAYSDAIQIAFTPHAVWLAAADGLTAIDPGTGAIIAAMGHSDVLGPDDAGVTVVGKEIWTTYKRQHKLQRVTGLP